MKLKIIPNRKYYYFFSGLLFVASLVSLFLWGLRPGLDFTGGSLMELSFATSRPGSQEVSAALVPLNLGDLIVQQAGEKEIMLRFKAVDEATHQGILQTISDKFAADSPEQIKELQFESIGPVIGKELQQKAWWQIFLVSLGIIIYIAFAFRKVSKPLASWKYGVSAIIALLHDIVIVAGFFSVLGHFFNVEIDALFITALLTIMGFSVHDTIVVFDRTRENITRHHGGTFAEVVNDSVNQTIVRSVNTSLTVLLVLLSLYILGGATIKNFVLALLFGIAIGTYSSIFVASPVIVDWNNFGKKTKSAR
ncbi:MAG: protein translocase subunit SecF [Patescibacteria group bacterium]